MDGILRKEIKRYLHIRCYVM